MAGEVRAVGNELDGGLLGSHDGRRGVENLTHPHVQFHADFVPLAVLNLVVVLVIRLATSADWHEQRPVVHDVVAEPVANLHPEVVRLGDNRGLGDARAPHREVARRQRRRLDNDGQRHLVFAHDLPVHRDPQLVRPGFDRGEGQAVESVEHVGHPHGDLLSAVLIDVPPGGVQSRGDRDLRGGVRVVLGVVPVDVPRLNHQLLSLAGDEGVIAHAARIVAHHPRVCVENNRALRRRSRRRRDQLERRTLHVSPAQGHVQLVRSDGSVDLVPDAIGAPLHLVPASRLRRDGYAREGSVQSRDEGVTRRGDDDVERVGDGLEVLRNVVLVHRFDDEDVVFAGDSADRVRDSARRLAVNLGFFIRTASVCGVFDRVREQRGRFRVCRRQVERRVLDVRGADHHRETLVRSSDGRHERQGVGSVFVIPHRGEHGRIPVQRRRHHLPADGPRAPKLVPRGERERRLFPRHRGEIRAVRRDVLHGRFLRHRSSGGEGNLGVRRVTSGDPLELDVQLVTTRGVRQQGDVEGTSGRVGQIARRGHVRRRRSRSRRGERRRAVAVGERSRLVRNRVTVRVPSDYSDVVLHPRETAEEPRAVHGGRRRVQGTLRDGHGRRPGYVHAVQRGGEYVSSRRFGRNRKVVVPASLVPRRRGGDDVVGVGYGHSVERERGDKGVVAVAGFVVTLRVAVRVRRVHAQHELVAR